MKKNTLTGIFGIALLITAANVQASQKIVSFEAAYRGAAIAKNIENLGGGVIKQFSIIDALVAVFPDNIKNAGIYTLAGVTDVAEDKYIRWIEEAPGSMNAIPLPGTENIFSMIRSGEGWVGQRPLNTHQ